MAGGINRGDYKRGANKMRAFRSPLGDKGYQVTGNSSPPLDLL